MSFNILFQFYKVRLELDKLHNLTEIDHISIL